MPDRPCGFGGCSLSGGVVEQRWAFLAERWGSRFEVLEGAGHINVAAGFGPWPEMREWVRQGAIDRRPKLAA